MEDFGKDEENNESRKGEREMIEGKEWAGGKEKEKAVEERALSCSGRREAREERGAGKEVV